MTCRGPVRPHGCPGHSSGGVHWWCARPRNRAPACVPLTPRRMPRSRMVDRAMRTRVFEFNGNAFDDLEGFLDEIQRILRPVTRAATLAAFSGAVACGGSNRTPEAIASEEQLRAAEYCCPHELHERCGYCMYPPRDIPGPSGCPAGCRRSDGGVLQFEHAQATLDAAPPVDAAADEAPEPVDPINAALERLASDAAAEPRPQPAADPCMECCDRGPLCPGCACPDRKGGGPYRPRRRVRR